MKIVLQIRCTLAWREDYKPDEITAVDIEEQSKTGKMYFNYEFTKQGWPIVYMKLNRDQGHDRVTKVRGRGRLSAEIDGH